jgi:hypothetical protein
MESIQLATMAIITIGIIISAVEDVRLPSNLFQNGLFDWKYCLAFQPILRPKRSSFIFNLVFGYTAFQVSAILRIIGSLGTLVGLLYAPVIVHTFLILCITAYFYLFYRLPYALDGSDQITLFVLIGTLIMTLDGGSGEFVRLGAAAITIHAVLSYLTSGVAKLLSQLWRNGKGLTGVMTSAEFGNSLIGRFLTHRPIIAAIVSWYIIFSHLFVGGAYLFGGKIALVAVCMSAAFHIAVATVMRLNNFVWSFAAIYPSVLFLSSHDVRVSLVHDLIGSR